jgi:thymidylate synthase
MRQPLVFESFTQAYYALVADTYAGYEYETAPRGMKIRENLFTSFAITNPRDRLLYIPDRKFSLQYVMAEILWYLSGNNETAWISNYSSFWKDISDDGVTANSAYGARIYKAHPYQNGSAFMPHPEREGYVQRNDMPQGWTQWKFVKEELTKDPDSRRAVIHIRQPQDSYLAKKDVPCTLNLQFFIRDKKLHMIVQMRSNDLILGTALDVPAFTFMQELMALELGLDVGTYYHTSNSMHVYERHYDMCEKILNADTTLASTAMPALKEAPPIDKLMDLERRARLATKSQELIILGSEARMYSDILWTDWAHILLAHRAKKIGDAALEKWFNEGLTLKCFKDLTEK